MVYYVDTFGYVHGDIDDSCTSGIDKILYRQQMEATEKALNNIKSQIKKRKGDQKNENTRNY